ncbi:hypothetical protein ACFSZS_04885 [Seohaeicola zhoushanensis]
MAGFATRNRFAGHASRSTKTRYALRLKPDHSIGAGHEELDADTPWADVAPGFRDTLGRVTGILDDLRLHSGTETPQSVQTVFTPRTLAAHLKDTFHAAAEANGITLRLALSQQSDMLIRSDYGRIYIALSKLIHNAIVHSQGSETVLSVLMTRASKPPGPSPGRSAITGWAFRPRRRAPCAALSTPIPAA